MYIINGSGGRAAAIILAISFRISSKRGFSPQADFFSLVMHRGSKTYTKNPFLDC